MIHRAGKSVPIASLWSIHNFFVVSIVPGVWGWEL